MPKHPTKKPAAKRKTKAAKLRVDIITIHPTLVTPYTKGAIIGRAQGQGLLKVTAHDLRKFAVNKYGSVDAKPFGGGPGMVMLVEPFEKALKKINAKRGKKSERIILFSAKGKQFTTQDAIHLSTYKRLVLLCGRYEGVDERVAQNLVDEEYAIGPYVLTGGELPALVLTDAVARHIPGVLGDHASLAEESHNIPGQVEAPQYTRPAEYKSLSKKIWRVPDVLLSGDHKKINEWRATHHTKSQG